MVIPARTGVDFAWVGKRVLTEYENPLTFLLFKLVKGERPIDGGKLGKYFIDRTSSIRSKSLLLLEEDIVSAPL